MTNLMGIPAGASFALSEIFRTLREFPPSEPENHVVLALGLDGPVMLAGPNTGGLIILETNESVEQDDGTSAAIVQNLKENSHAFQVEYLRLPLRSLINTGWNIFNYGRPPSAEVYRFIHDYDEAGLLATINKKSSTATVGKAGKHVPSISTAELEKLSQIAGNAFFKGAGDAKLVLDGFEQVKEGVYSVDNMLPIIMAHAAMDWTPIVLATGYGLAIKLVEDNGADFGYRLESVAVSNPIYVSLAVIETAKRLVKDGEIDLGISLRKFRRWLVKNGYNTNKIDTLVIDE